MRLYLYLIQMQFHEENSFLPLRFQYIALLIFQHFFSIKIFRILYVIQHLINILCRRWNLTITRHIFYFPYHFFRDFTNSITYAFLTSNHFFILIIIFRSNRSVTIPIPCNTILNRRLTKYSLLTTLFLCDILTIK